MTRILACLRFIVILLPALSLLPLSAEDAAAYKPTPEEIVRHKLLDEVVEKPIKEKKWKKADKFWLGNLLLGGLSFHTDYGYTNNLGSEETNGVPEKLDNNERTWGIGGGFKGKKFLRDVVVSAMGSEAFGNKKNERLTYLKDFLLDRVTFDATVRYGRTGKVEPNGDIELTRKTTWEAKIQYSIPIEQFFRAPKYK